jgi:hypothetical protein
VAAVAVVVMVAVIMAKLAIELAAEIATEAATMARLSNIVPNMDFPQTLPKTMRYSHLMLAISTLPSSKIRGLHWKKNGAFSPMHLLSLVRRTVHL